MLESNGTYRRGTTVRSYAIGGSNGSDSTWRTNATHRTSKTNRTHRPKSG